MPFGFDLKTALDLARKVDRAFEAQEKQGEAIGKLTDRLVKLEERVLILEQREELVIEKAKSAASAAASVVASGQLSDIARRVGGLEERGRIAAEGPSRRRLPKPEGG